MALVDNSFKETKSHDLPARRSNQKRRRILFRHELLAAQRLQRRGVHWEP